MRIDDFGSEGPVIILATGASLISLIGLILSLVLRRKRPSSEIQKLLASSGGFLILNAGIIALFVWRIVAIFNRPGLYI